MSDPFISICIPAYKNTAYLQRLLNSIALQTFTDFEVVITDDSNDDTVQQFISENTFAFTIKYIRNSSALGSPENWNAALRSAKGRWIKMMHDDDWFSFEASLQIFAETARNNDNNTFIFSGYIEVDSTQNTSRKYIISNIEEKLLRRSPLCLFKENFIGHPSTTLIKSGSDIYYDKNFKWVVDIEFYTRYLSGKNNFIAIKKTLITIGVNDLQITKSAFRNPAIEVPENLLFLNKLSTGSLKNIYVFDYFWRFVRNLSLRNLDDVARFAPNIPVHPIISQMIKAQAQGSHKLLKVGIVSKSLMLLLYIKSYRSL